MNLVELPTGRVSLEFRAAEFDALLGRLRVFGKVSRDAMPSYDLLSVGGEQFILMNDWDEPCLISRTQPGDDLLRQALSVSPVRRRAAG